ncbi:hypothetical protein [Roseobacter sp. N2S]|uniref:hypothetical protein n=1 Tax=Roseobacter sp. N2S TaxID=2663844 RepID=UPI00285AEF68|nr:hypothetical protein [Roseobacter sp. N2S]MDR6266547.1 hypothetical protein [Roseobacter sp. N2S]
MAPLFQTPRLAVYPYQTQLARSVFDFLDLNDLAEGRAVRGDPEATALDMFLDWHGANTYRLISHVITTRKSGRETPFAVLGLSHTGYAGVGQVALLARHHHLFARPLAETCVLARKNIEAVARRRGLTRLEARSWAGHPSGGRLLETIGFALETQMPGFGDGEIFEQYGLQIPTTSTQTGD